MSVLPATQGAPLSRAAPGNVRAALRLLRERGEPAPEALVAAGYAHFEALVQSVADQLKLPRLKLDALQLGPELTQAVPRALAERNRIVPVFASADEVTLATCDPSRIELFDCLRGELKRHIVLVVAAGGEIDRAIQRLYDSPVLKLVDARSDESPVSQAALEEASQVIDRLIKQASEQGASDIHIEATEQGTVIRMRVDGLLRQIETRPAEGHSALISRLKVMAALDISERFVPQDGRIKLRQPSGDIDVRISVLPTYYGEKVCCRILNNSRAQLPMEELGFSGGQLSCFQRMIQAPYGLVLVTGPTGSGKSMTLYSALNALRSPGLNIVSVEDPVEYQLPGINQVQVNPKRGITFPNALRSILRQDPNVILVGEIRDRETGTIAAEAALTGHLVLASLHTNDALSAVTRLAELGIERYLMGPALVGIVAQRLVRKLCPDCSTAYVPDAAELELLGLPELPPEVTFRKCVGCKSCQGRGFSGRTAVRELLEVDAGLRAAISRGESEDVLGANAAAHGFRNMRMDALSQLFSGRISSQEVVRVTRS